MVAVVDSSTKVYIASQGKALCVLPVTPGVPLSRTITAGAGLTGGGDLSQDRTIELDSDSIASLELADTATQPGDNVSTLTNDAGYVDTATASAAAPVQTVAGRTGAVTIAAEDITDSTAEGRTLLTGNDAARQAEIVARLAGATIAPAQVNATTHIDAPSLRYGGTDILARANTWTAAQIIRGALPTPSDATDPTKVGGGRIDTAERIISRSTEVNAIESLGGITLAADLKLASDLQVFPSDAGGVLRQGFQNAGVASSYAMTLAGAGTGTTLLGSGVLGDNFRRFRLLVSGEVLAGDGTVAATTSAQFLSGQLRATGTDDATAADNGAMRVNGGLGVIKSIVQASTAFHYFGPTGVDGSWRLGRSGADFVHQRREAGSWVTKQTIAA